jgi:hypothetical protein
MEQRTAHPLDIDLLSAALGDADAALASEVEEHLGTCLLCRIHMARIRRSGVVPESIAAPSITYPTISPEVLSVLDGRNRPAKIEPGQVWLAGSPHRVVVWIDDVDMDDSVATVCAATLDVEAADHTSLLLRLERLGHDIAVFTSVTGTVPFDRLDRYVEDLQIHDEIGRLTDAIANGVAVDDLPIGAPILGGTDERLEFRQLLADNLATLDPIADDDDELDNDGLEEFERAVVEMQRQLSSDLSSRRGALCHVQMVDELLVGSFAHSTSLRPVASIQELDRRVLVVTAVTEPDWAIDHPHDAYKLLLRVGASTLAVAMPFEPYYTKVFEPPLLCDAYELPDAHVRLPPHALWEARPMVKALFDYLEVGVFKVDHDSPPKPPPGNPDLSTHLHRQARAAVDSLRSIRATLGKHRALKNLTETDADDLAAALAESTDLDGVVARIKEITDR